MTKSRTISTKEAASLLDVSERTVRRYINDKKLTARKNNTGWRISYEDFNYFCNKNGYGIGLLEKWPY